MENITFSINQYDDEGDIITKGILLHVGDNLILRFNDSEELKEFGKKVLGIYVEIKNNWE